MARRTVPIPGQILKQTVVLGLTFDEIVVLSAIPLALVVPSTLIDFIPLSVTLGSVGVGAIGVLIVVFKTPKGQSPVQWFPAWVNRKVNPDKYILKPKDGGKHGTPEVNYLDVVKTAPLIKAEAELSAEEFDFEKFKASIEHAEKINRGGSENGSNVGEVNRSPGESAHVDARGKQDTQTNA